MENIKFKIEKNIKLKSSKTILFEMFVLANISNILIELDFKMIKF